MRKAAFFDRDGTLIKDVSYLSDLSQIEVLPFAVDLCLNLQREGFLLIVVTNQSGIARGFFDASFVEKTHDELKRMFLHRGVTFEKFYYCPHHPNDGCQCRKPSPGMLMRAAREYSIDMSQSLMFGDKKLDIEAGNAAGCKSFYINGEFLRR
jgi:D-glycero-D-manno-heptose 1,7-bisphosphate phosphatase